MTKGEMDGVPREDRPAVAIFRSPLFNASETFVRDHADGLRRYRPVLVGLHDRGGGAGAIVPLGLRERLGLTLFGRAGAMAARLTAERPCLVHAHFGTDGVLALPLAERLGVPLVTTLHGYEIGRSPGRMLLSGRLSWIRYALLKRQLAMRGRLFLAVSEALRTEALAAGFPAARTLVHYNGVDLDRFRADGSAPEAELVLHVGRLVEKKGTAVLLDAFAAVKARVPAASLVVIGEGPLRATLERRAAALGLAGTVCFTGALAPAAVAAWMRRAWLLAVPSHRARDGDSEGLPMVICEAAASGLPVVASRHSGIPEGVVDGETGLLVPERTPGPLAAAIVALLGNPPLRARLASKARALAGVRFDAARQIERLETLYDEALGTGAATARCG
ncbi:glycosyltransferase [Sphingomonas parva]|uniref:Glycosyltransferase n=1 Tax=Sphingomonas parva TaxID=2555898 RepID=A0A4Y8ZRF0_9SPHN|nr:glycosyltransferase [Sphingomonas parva]TFI58610.1 glycosyltransferase [Sphingomonas parva]